MLAAGGMLAAVTAAACVAMVAVGGRDGHDVPRCVQGGAAYSPTGLQGPARPWVPLLRVRGGGDEGESSSADYEKERAATLRKNREMLAQFGLEDVKKEITAVREKKRRQKRAKLLPAPDAPLRRSSRAAAKRAVYVESSQEDPSAQDASADVWSDGDGSASSHTEGDDVSSPEEIEEHDDEPSGDEDEARAGGRRRRRRPEGKRTKRRGATEFLCPSWAPREGVLTVLALLRATCKCMHALHACVHACMRGSMHMHTHTCVCACTYTEMHSEMHTNMRARTHACVDGYVHR